MSPHTDDASDSSDSGLDDESEAMAQQNADRASSSDKSVNNDSKTSKTPKAKSKDADRPKRKKARRACAACQRAHLTCGDERPCSRCIKRGLQDQCQDGVRKKAKYLHDAPAEALVPNFSGNYPTNGAHSTQSSRTPRQISSASLPHPGNFYPQTPSNSYPPYSSVSQHGQMAPPIMDSVNALGEFTSQPNVETPSQFYSNSPQQVSPVQSLSANMDQTPVLGDAGNASFEANLFDSNDLSNLNFNISEFNFDNHYGAMEFGMLAHLSSGAVNTPDLDPMGQVGPANQGSISYESGGFAPNYGYAQTYQPWQRNPRQNSSQQWNFNSFDAFAVGETTGSVGGASEYSQGQSFDAGYSSTNVSPEMSFVQPDETQNGLVSVALMPGQKRKQAAFSSDPLPPGPAKKRRSTSGIYDDVKSPYPYTQGFHNLIHFLKSRFPSNKVVRIAKALASFRPSFISCNKNLDTADLIFMEQGFQRTLFEYEDYMDHYGTPTLICRRTGEVALVNKEFSLVTGWRRDVLLGKAPNLNVNTGSNRSGTETGASSKGTVTPRVPNIDIDPGRPQPVFLAELLDQDSVVQFYEDFAELAFGASRSSIIGAKCDIYKYKTKDDPGWSAKGRNTEEDKRGKTQHDAKLEPQLMKFEAGAQSLGGLDGKLAAALCWTVKRDVFDIPMLIVINFLPII